ncbi:MAG: carbohydrate porin [Terriglobia bacterium]
MQLIFEQLVRPKRAKGLKRLASCVSLLLLVSFMTGLPACAQTASGNAQATSSQPGVQTETQPESGAPSSASQASGSQPSTSEGSATSAANTTTDATTGATTDTTIFNHPAGRFWLSGQINFISQANPSFPAAYSGTNSFGPKAQAATSRVLTLYTGLKLNDSAQVILDIESAAGHALSNGAGLGGFTDLDIVRTPNLGQAPYLARFLVEKTFSLGGGSVENDRSYLSLPSSLPARRIEIWMGKFSVVDFFDVNPVGSDSHLQFMNWTVDNNGAYDYAANTRGYSWGAVVQFYDRNWAVRFGEAMMPKVANGENLDADLARAHAENLEFELDPTLFQRRATTLRFLSYVNHADMGSYRGAISGFLSGRDAAPDVTLYRQQGRVKYGFGANLYQEIGAGVRLFGRWGWNDGRNESFAYTEVDRTVSLGGDVAGSHWRRNLDKIGTAFVVNQISGDHRRYLELGGKGFLLGDGGLSYGFEQISESYYTCHLWRGVFGSADFQYVTNPGYNRARGPALVPSLRLHVDF